MATNSNWTVVFDDKSIINQDVKNDAGYPTGYIINDSLWDNPKFANIWAIQYKIDDLDYKDAVEHRDTTPHKSWNEAGLGDFREQFISMWDAAHLVQLQTNWDNDNIFDENGNIAETTAEKESRLGPRPTSYTSG